MKYFLERIASHIFEKYGDSIGRQCLVFPNRRAGLYFMKYLSVYAGKPLWAPSVKTINELFTSFSDLHIAGPEALIFELYRVYKNLNKKAGTFDEFYFWGEMLINDFDNIDKYMVDAASLFSNLADLKRIDSEFGQLDDEKVKIIRQFWVNFNSGQATREKEEFLGLWSVLHSLYTEFRAALREKGMAYEGMILRDISEKCKRDQSPDFTFENYHFAGFNALNSCEKVLMNALVMKGKAKFYWDYDYSTVKDNPKHSAGFFIKENLKDFGNDMPADWDYATFVSKPSAEIKRNVIDTTSDIAQVKLLPSLLHDLGDINGGEAHHTAIVLADESLLIPILSSIPDNVHDLNITMGYPLKFSQVYSFIVRLLMLQRNARKTGEIFQFDHDDTLNILQHGIFSEWDKDNASGLLNKLINDNKRWVPQDIFKGQSVFEIIFTHVSTPADLHKYLRDILETLYLADESDRVTEGNGIKKGDIHNEFIFRTLNAMNRLESAMSGSDIQMTAFTYSRLLDKILRNVSIPFSGEPLNGIQVMGILETRALDFKNLILLSVNEGVLPRSSAGSSYIPHNLREAFGLPVIRHQDSIYAYYFYRLLHRAENVTFVYNSSAEGLKTGEMSRFLMQLDYLTSDKPLFRSMGYEIISRGTIPSLLERNSAHNDILYKTFLEGRAKALSPSAVNTWLNCRMKFYYRYVCGLKEPEKSIKEIDPAVFGKLLHGVMEKIYKPFTGVVISGEKIDDLRKDENMIRSAVNDMIRELYHSGEVTEPGGNDVITANILTSYTKMILKLDRSFAPVRIAGLEKFVSAQVKVQPGKDAITVTIGGYADRIDEAGGTIRIIDYKTGNVPMEIKSVSSLFDENDEKRNDAWFQILMYCEMLSSAQDGVKVRPSLYSVRNMPDVDFSDRLVISHARDNKVPIDDYSSIRSEYSIGLRTTLMNIFGDDIPFKMTEHKGKCSYCPYIKLCRR